MHVMHILQCIFCIQYNALYAYNTNDTNDTIQKKLWPLWEEVIFLIVIEFGRIQVDKIHHRSGWWVGGGMRNSRL